MKYTLKQGFITQKKGNQTSLFNGEESILYTFNETASFLFEQIKNGLDEDKIIELIGKKYRIEEKQAQLDLKKFIKDLKNKKIIY